MKPRYSANERYMLFICRSSTAERAFILIPSLIKWIRLVVGGRHTRRAQRYNRAAACGAHFNCVDEIIVITGNADKCASELIPEFNGRGPSIIFLGHRSFRHPRWRRPLLVARWWNSRSLSQLIDAPVSSTPTPARPVRGKQSKWKTGGGKRGNKKIEEEERNG